MTLLVFYHKMLKCTIRHDKCKGKPYMKIVNKNYKNYYKRKISVSN